MKAALTLLLVSVSTLFAQAQTISGSGGTFTSPTAIGSNITISGVTLTDGRHATLFCPITFFGASTYQWNWSCANGEMKIYDATGQAVEGVTVEFGAVTMNCSGGGRLLPTVCYRGFAGNTRNPDTGEIIAHFSASAKGGPNNAPGTVIVFTVTY